MKYKKKKSFERQELESCFLDDNPDALWKIADIDNNSIHELAILQIILELTPDV